MRSKSRWFATVTAVAWWASIAGVALATILLLVVAAHWVGGGALKLDFYFRLPAGSYHISSHELSTAAATVGISSGQLGFARPRIAFVLVAGAVFEVAAAWWLFILHQLRRLLASLDQGRTFARENSVRLTRIGWGVIGFELTHAVCVWLGTLYLKHVLVVRGLSVRAHFGVDVTVVLLGLLLLTLAAAFRVGSELAEEQALTV
ncbi:MAG: DUF2975 domain-containing protein [Solirubrobacterales bacterium]|nr:DUF2975 domain-containing protein [Solirubrobacterales bacterium]MBV9798772.1 DUF2975 domain-containing protein [Solirubrobacterales bacterium]